MIDQIANEFCARHPGRVLLGVSGGRDSMVMMEALLKQADRSAAEWVICHVNHGLRGVEADADEALVGKRAHELGATFVTTRLELSSKAGFEKAARDGRYQFFAQCARKFETFELVLAHHASDQVETVLFNLLRGSSRLKGMDAERRRVVDGVELVIHRPFLSVSRAEIDAYVEEHGVAFHEDATNSQPVATRNRMRNEVLPLIRDVMGREVSAAVVRAEQLAKETDDFVTKSVDYSTVLDPQGRLFVPKLQSLHVVQQRYVIQRYLSEQQVKGISSRVIEESLQLLDLEGPARINLSGGRFLRRKGQRVFVD